MIPEIIYLYINQTILDKVKRVKTTSAKKKSYSVNLVLENGFHRNKLSDGGGVDAGALAVCSI